MRYSKPMPTTPPLTELPFLPFIDSDGKLPSGYANQIGAFAIYDQQQSLVHLGFSRNVLLSLKQSLIRSPDNCHWVKIVTIERPSKSQLLEIVTQWETEVGGSPYSKQNPQPQWTESINLHEHMTPEEQTAHAGPDLDARGKVKLLKQVSRRLEAVILSKLEMREFQDELRFNPKLKESGLLDVKD